MTSTVSSSCNYRNHWKLKWPVIDERMCPKTCLQFNRAALLLQVFATKNKRCDSRLVWARRKGKQIKQKIGNLTLTRLVLSRPMCLWCCECIAIVTDYNLAPQHPWQLSTGIWCSPAKSWLTAEFEHSRVVFRGSCSAQSDSGGVSVRRYKRGSLLMPKQEMSAC